MWSFRRLLIIRTLIRLSVKPNQRLILPFSETCTNKLLTSVNFFIKIYMHVYMCNFKVTQLILSNLCSDDLTSLQASLFTGN